MSRPLKILLADADGLTRRALQRSLNADQSMQVALQAAGVAECVRKAESVDIDVVVIREQRPKLDCMLVARTLATRGIDRIVCVATGSEPVYLRHLIGIGVAGLLDASCRVSELCEAIRRVGNGKSYISPNVAAGLVGQAGSASPLERLSKREIQVLNLISGGLGGPEIGRKLGLSPKTVSTYRSRICTKLELPRPGDLPDLARRLVLSVGSAET